MDPLKAQIYAAMEDEREAFIKRQVVFGKGLPAGVPYVEDLDKMEAAEEAWRAAQRRVEQLVDHWNATRGEADAA